MFQLLALQPHLMQTCGSVKNLFQSNGCCNKTDPETRLTTTQCADLTLDVHETQVQSNQDYDASHVIFDHGKFISETLLAHPKLKARLDTGFDPGASSACPYIWTEQAYMPGFLDENQGSLTHTGYYPPSAMKWAQGYRVPTHPTGGCPFQNGTAEFAKEAPGWWPNWAGNFGHEPTQEGYNAFGLEKFNELVSNGALENQDIYRTMVRTFSPDNYEFYHDKVFYPLAGSPFVVQFDVKKMQRGELDVEKYVVVYKDREDGSGVTDFISQWDGLMRGTVRVIKGTSKGDMLLSCGHVGSLMKQGNRFSKVGCAQYPISPEEGITSTTPQRFVITDDMNAIAPAKLGEGVVDVAMNKPDPGGLGQTVETKVLKVNLNNNIRDYITNADYAFLAVDINVAKYNTTTETQMWPSIGAVVTKTILRIDLKTGGAVMTEALEKLSEAHVQQLVASQDPAWNAHESSKGGNLQKFVVEPAGRLMRLTFDDSEHVHVNFRTQTPVLCTDGTYRAMTPKESIDGKRESPCAINSTIAVEVMNVAKFPLDFQKGAIPSGRVHLPIDGEVFFPNGQVAVHYWSMHHIASTRGKIYFTSGFRMHSVSASYGFFPPRSAITFIPWKDESAPLSGLRAAWEGGVVERMGMVYFTFQRSPFTRSSWTGERNDILAHTQDDTKQKGGFTRDWHVTYVKVDPETDTIVQIYNVVREEFAICYFGGVTPDAQFFITGCAMPGSRQTGDRGIVSMDRWLVAPEETAKHEASYTSEGVRAVRNTTFGTRRLEVSPVRIHMEGPGGTQHVDVDGLQHSILKLHRDSKTTLVGSNLMNMGRPDYWPDFKDAPYEKNVIIGTDAGNMRSGMQRNIIIGTNIGNFHPGSTEAYLEGAQYIYDSNGVTVKGRDRDPASGILQIGHDEKPLISGNFDAQVLNTAPLRSLEDTRAAISGVPYSATDKNVLFQRNNIVQTTALGNVDGVKLILDDISLLQEEMCKTKYMLSCATNQLLNASNLAAPCMASFDPASCSFSPALLTITVVNILTGDFQEENGFIIEFRPEGAAEWTQLIKFHYAGSALKIEKGSLAEGKFGYEVVPQGGNYVVRMERPKKELLGAYRITLTDSWGDGWQTTHVGYATLSAFGREPVEVVTWGELSIPGATNSFSTVGNTTVTG